MSMFPSPLKALTAVRGATTLVSDTPKEYEQAVIQLIQEMITLNHFEESDLLNIFFTVTSDLHSANPARITRTHFGWNKTPMMCSLEPDVTGHPPFCIRVMFQYQASSEHLPARPLYLNDAKSLRPDLSQF